MTKILFLLAPSEGKNEGGSYNEEKLSFSFEKPINIAKNVTEKDLKCKGERFNEGLKLNNQLTSPQPSPQGEGVYTEAIKRYSGVVFNAINYSGMSESGKKFFENNILITSGMYGLVKPLDIIGNYKLPIESKGLYKFWGEKVLDELNKINPDFIVNLLPNSYYKMIIPKKLKSKIININFLTEKEGKIVKMSHGVKKYRGEFLKNVCENNLIDYGEFGGEVVEGVEWVDVNIII